MEEPDSRMDDLVKARYELGIWQIVDKIKKRVTFFGVYRLFDKLEQ